jgi:hypothetical protein
MVRSEIKGMINKKAYHTIRDIRKDWKVVRVNDSGMVSILSDDWKVWVAKIGGVYIVAAIEEID